MIKNVTPDRVDLVYSNQIKIISFGAKAVKPQKPLVSNQCVKALS
jgi:hypothetical protein